MDKMKKLVCECCGGLIDRDTLTCRSCGVAYKLDEYMHPIRIMEYSTRVDTLSNRESNNCLLNNKCKFEGNQLYLMIKGENE